MVASIQHDGTVLSPEKERKQREHHFDAGRPAIDKIAVEDESVR